MATPLSTFGSLQNPGAARQNAFTPREGYEVIGTFKESGSGVNWDRAEQRKVAALITQRRSSRLIGREPGLSKNAVADIVKQNHKAVSTGT